ncbi:2-polyprenyl-6-methoxyphenol hydroxylase-like FAD-dependent oxidoreductase [Lipingzhangella halophila]|uniref:2-polyprenyl-6-methoxyphenol hydroxylase-like FAD-dependent oxidoreductase n=1 Tax=Lipingzhangella halophila TaxID=1783352 RepID=A0A7W7RCT2_9ACTN|nr:FAD-dependent oxidoreductase [Lipingzhangella halophila]MBB4929617.1 2-polyprenyl-6-methoxyphenol hydroxylase-like FAD-dependent oxidoreductase [Lipingzhangella halophila]
MLPTTTEVLIVGAGPIGLSTAVALTQQGRDVTVIDNQAAGANTSRAAVVHAHTLEILDPYGVSAPMVARGVHTSRFTIRDRDRILIPVEFSELPTKYPYTLMISQADTEAILLDRLKELGGTVLRPYTLTTLEQDGDGVTATVEGGERVRASYVVGADGMHSTVREQTGIGFEGGTYAESFTLADVRLSGGVPQNEVILYFSPAGLVVVAPLPDGRHRIVATVDEAPQHPDAAFAQGLLDARGPEAAPAVVDEVVWGSRFRVHHRIADTFRSGRVLLAGDAAHVHSPAGGQGMNLGIEDAVSMSQTLGRVLDGGSPDLLDTWAASRRPVAQEVVALASRLTRIATLGRARRPLRNTVLGLLGRVPGVRNRLAWRLAGLTRRWTENADGGR